MAAVALSVAFALCFCWISVWVGMMARTPGAVQGIMFLLVLAAVLRQQHLRRNRARCPAGCRLSSRSTRSPIWSTRCAGLMLGGPVATHLLWTLAWMAGLLVVFVPLAMRAYRRRT